MKKNKKIRFGESMAIGYVGHSHENYEDMLACSLCSPVEHTHWFTSKAEDFECWMCGEKFDLPIEPVYLEQEDDD